MNGKSDRSTHSGLPAANPVIDLGIDFGTTNCTVARVRPDGGIHQQGPVPSIGALCEDEVFFGEEARDRLLSDSREVVPVRDLKLLLRQDECTLGDRIWDTRELVARLLAHLRRLLIGDEPVGMLVVGTPVNIEPAQRDRMREAASRAGFRDLQFVYEPTAALLGALDQQELSREALALVVDWGGGTLDLSVVRHENRLYRDLDVEGDVADLGGTLIDEAITSSLLRGQPHVSKALQRVPQGFERLKEEVELEKIRMLDELDSQDDPESLPLSGWIAPAWLDEDLQVDSAVVVETLRRFAGRATQRIETMLERANLRATHITDVLFAGGTCKARVIREQIAARFPAARILRTRNPQLLTGIGCARLLKAGFQLELAADLVVREADDHLFTLLPRGIRVELGSCRCAEFMVTDLNAPEAIFDFGICHVSDNQRSMRAAGSDGFQSLHQMFISAGQPKLKQAGISERVRLHIGINRNLEVAVHAETQISQCSVQNSIQGVPLAIRVGT